MISRVALVLLLIAARVAAAELNLANWVGRYPVNKDAGFENFFEVPATKAELKKMLTRSEWKLLTQVYTVSPPIELIEKHLVVQCCKPHNCPFEHAMVVIDLERKGFHVGLFSSKDRRMVKWISSEGDSHELPDKVRELFYYGHTPR